MSKLNNTNSLGVSAEDQAISQYIYAKFSDGNPPKTTSIYIVDPEERYPECNKRRPNRNNRVPCNIGKPEVCCELISYSDCVSVTHGEWEYSESGFPGYTEYNYRMLVTYTPRICKYGWPVMTNKTLTAEILCDVQLIQGLKIELISTQDIVADSTDIRFLEPGEGLGIIPEEKETPWIPSENDTTAAVKVDYEVTCESKEDCSGCVGDCTGCDNAFYNDPYNDNTKQYLLSLDVSSVVAPVHVGKSFMEGYANACINLLEANTPDFSKTTSVCNAFMYAYLGSCYRLKLVSGPSLPNLTSIGEYFLGAYAYGCSSLTELGMPYLPKLAYANHAFMFYYAGGTAVETLHVPDLPKLTCIGASFMFAYAAFCTKLKTLYIRDLPNVLSFGDDPFGEYARGCSSLQDVYWGSWYNGLMGSDLPSTMFEGTPMTKVLHLRPADSSKSNYPPATESPISWKGTGWAAIRYDYT